MTKEPATTRSSFFRGVWPIFVALIVFTYLFGLGIPLLGPDEPRYAQVAREMFERGDWVTPTLGGSHWFEKPVLLYWLQIAAYNAFGVSEVTARLGSACFGLATIAALWMLGEFLARRDDEMRRSGIAWLLPVMGAASFGLLAFSRGASFDIILTFPMTAAMIAFYVFARRSSEGRPAKAPLVAFYFFIGVALLAKGLVGIVFPLGIAAAYYVLSLRRPSNRFIFSILWGTLVAAAVAATWYLPMYLRNGWEFIDQFFIQHHFQRYTSNKYFHPQPFYFFLWVLPLMTLPWIAFFFHGLWTGTRDAFRERRNAASLTAAPPIRTDLFIFSAAWILVPLAFFSFSGSKLPGYILPALPPSIIIAAMSAMRFFRGSATRVRLVQAAAVLTLVVSVALLIFVVPQFADKDSVREMMREADGRGYSGSKVAMLYTVVHNAEFYAPGRIIRTGDGRQRQFNNTGELIDQLRTLPDRSALVLLPPHLSQHLSADPAIAAEQIADNGEYALALVRLRESAPTQTPDGRGP